MTYCVYAIGLTEDLIEPYDECYIGVTNNVSGRWYSHQRASTRVGQVIREYTLQQHNMIVIFEGSEEECFEMEARMRPIPFMGLNVAVGGHGGYTQYTQERNEKISKANKGKKKSLEHRNKQSKIMSDGRVANEKNGMAKKWKLISPIGDEFLLEGNLFSFCDERKLLTNTLRWYINSVVPEISPKYRQKTKESLIMRQNTTGWSLVELTGREV